MARRLEPGEVFNKELEDTQLECQSVAEQRAAMEAMRDYAAAMYRAYAGRPWSPAKGSRASHVTTASQISALDFLRARSERRRDRYDPQGPVVVVSGPQDRSAERRVGKECVSACRFRWSPFHYKKKKKN